MSLNKESAYMKGKSHRNAAPAYEYSSVRHGKRCFKTLDTSPCHSYFNKINTQYHGHKVSRVAQDV
jgi:hypothetical protein